MLFLRAVFKARTYIKVHAGECTTASGSPLFGAERRWFIPQQPQLPLRQSTGGKWRRIIKQDQEEEGWKQSDARWREGRIRNRGAEMEKEEWSELKDEGREGDPTGRRRLGRRLFTDSEQLLLPEWWTDERQEREARFGWGGDLRRAGTEPTRKTGQLTFCHPFLSSFVWRDWAQIPQRTGTAAATVTMDTDYTPSQP